MSTILLASPDHKHSVTIDKGELISFTVNSEEIIHQKGNPGWRNSDTEMFPLIGATSPINFRVSTPRGECIQDQHGLLRELDYQVINQTPNSVSFDKNYIKNTPIENSKFPEKSPEEFVSWPYDFTFTKKYLLTNEGLQIEFIIDAELGMPYMLGYHPAFMLEGNKKEIIKTTSKEISIDQIMEVGDSAFPLLNTSTLSLITENGSSIKIGTKGFENFMLWTPATNMLCIEPITYYPNATDACLSKEMFKIATESKENFEVTISSF